jgi:hypothetical protein
MSKKILRNESLEDSSNLNLSKYSYSYVQSLFLESKSITTTHLRFVFITEGSNHILCQMPKQRTLNFPKFQYDKITIEMPEILGHLLMSLQQMFGSCADSSLVHSWFSLKNNSKKPIVIVVVVLKHLVGKLFKKSSSNDLIYLSAKELTTSSLDKFSVSLMEELLKRNLFKFMNDERSVEDYFNVENYFSHLISCKCESHYCLSDMFKKCYKGDDMSQTVKWMITEVTFEKEEDKVKYFANKINCVKKKYRHENRMPEVIEKANESLNEENLRLYPTINPSAPLGTMKRVVKHISSNELKQNFKDSKESPDFQTKNSVRFSLGSFYAEQ